MIVADREGDALAENSSRRAGVIVADLSTADCVNQEASWVLDSLGGVPDVLINNLGVGNALLKRNFPTLIGRAAST